MIMKRERGHWGGDEGEGKVGGRSVCVVLRRMTVRMIVRGLVCFMSQITKLHKLYVKTILETSSSSKYKRFALIYRFVVGGAPRSEGAVGGAVENNMASSHSHLRFRLTNDLNDGKKIFDDQQ
jgi:hypothetical protein